MTRPTLSVRPIGPNQIEVRTHCPHEGFRVGYQLGETVTERAAAVAAIAHHHIMSNCECMWRLWPRYRTDSCPADLDAFRSRFEGVWRGVEDQQRRRGYAVIDWPAAVEQMRGKDGAA